MMAEAGLTGDDEDSVVDDGDESSVGGELSPIPGPPSPDMSPPPPSGRPPTPPPPPLLETEPAEAVPIEDAQVATPAKTSGNDKREAELMADLGEMTRKFLELRMQLEEEKSNVEMLSEAAGKGKKKNLANEAIVLRKALDRRSQDVQTALLKGQEVRSRKDHEVALLLPLLVCVRSGQARGLEGGASEKSEKIVRCRCCCRCSSAPEAGLLPRFAQSPPRP
jgi:hypothetical protein